MDDNEFKEIIADAHKRVLTLTDTAFLSKAYFKALDKYTRLLDMYAIWDKRGDK